MIIKVKTLVFCENFMSKETFTYLFFNSSLFSLCDHTQEGVKRIMLNTLLSSFIVRI